RLRTVGSDPLPIIDNHTRRCWINLPRLTRLGPARPAVHRGGHGHVTEPQTRDIQVTARRNISRIVTTTQPGTLQYRVAMVLGAILLAQIDTTCSLVGRFPQISSTR